MFNTACVLVSCFSEGAMGCLERKGVLCKWAHAGRSPCHPTSSLHLLHSLLINRCCS